jgi:hypothetical protein
MPVCAKVAGFANNITVVDPVKDANGVIIGSVSGTDYAKCEMVIVTGPEYKQAAGLSISAADGAVASGLIVGCWVTAYAVRSVIATFRGSSKDE